MKRYEFRMAKVLRVREIQEEAARAGVATAQVAQRRAEQALESSQAHYRGLAGPASPQDASAFLALREQASHRATAVRLADGNRQVAADATVSAIATWQETNRRVDALERLDERRREEYGIEVRRAEDATVDEIVVARARTRRSSSAAVATGTRA